MDTKIEKMRFSTQVYKEKFYKSIECLQFGFFSAYAKSAWRQICVNDKYILRSGFKNDELRSKVKAKTNE